MLVRLCPMVKHVLLVIVTWSRIILTVVHTILRLIILLLLACPTLSILAAVINYPRMFIAMLSAPAFPILSRITCNTTR